MEWMKILVVFLLSMSGTPSLLHGWRVFKYLVPKAWLGWWFPQGISFFFPILLSSSSFFFFPCCPIIHNHLHIHISSSTSITKLSYINRLPIIPFPFVSFITKPPLYQEHHSYTKPLNSKLCSSFDLSFNLFWDCKCWTFDLMHESPWNTLSLLFFIFFAIYLWLQ